jgi:hypothetical protein
MFPLWNPEDGANMFPLWNPEHGANMFPLLNPEDGANMYPLNVGKLLPHYTVSHPRRQHS